MRYINCLFIIFLVFFSCKKETPETQLFSLTFDFQHQFDGEILTFNNTDFVNAAGNKMGFYNFKYLISGIELIQADGSVQSLEEEFAFINPIQDRTNFTIDSLPEGDYQGFKFMIGLEETVNTSNPNLYAVDHPLSPLLNGMHWSWQEGYIFLAMEGTFEKEDASIGAFTYHIAFEENQMKMNFSNEAFSLNKNLTANLVFDVGEVFQNPTMFDIWERGNFSHSSNDNNIATDLSQNAMDALKVLSYE